MKDRSCFFLHRRAGFKVTVQERLQSAAGNAWTDVWTNKPFAASTVSRQAVAAGSAAEFFTYSSGTYSVVTSALVADGATKFFRVTVTPVYEDASVAVASTISTITPDLAAVSGITLTRGNPIAATLASRDTGHIAEGHLLSWVGHNPATAKL